MCACAFNIVYIVSCLLHVGFVVVSKVRTEKHAKVVRNSVDGHMVLMLMLLPMSMSLKLKSITSILC